MLFLPPIGHGSTASLILFDHVFLMVVDMVLRLGPIEVINMCTIAD